MSHAKFDAVIGGGSFVGLTLAIALAKAAPGAFRIAVVDSLGREGQLAAAFDGRTAAISAAAREMLAAIGVWEAVEAHAQPIASISITDSALDAPIRTELLNFDGMLSARLPAAFILENFRLRRALFEAAQKSPDITLFMPDAVTGFEIDEKAAGVTLQSGASLEARLLVAADGQNSRLRGIAGVKALRWPSAQSGIVTTVSHERPHHGRAVQHFLPAGPFAMLPLTENRTSLVWTEASAEASRLLALDDDALIDEIGRRFGHDLGRLSLMSRPAAYPLSMTLAREFVRHRFALAGDAAHALHWIAGQGLNHGLKDAAALAETLADAARLGLDIGALPVLRRYERWRRFDSASSAFAAGGLSLLFSNDIMPLRQLRGLGLGLAGRMEPLKRFFVREAAGITGDTPKLLRGELP